MGISDNLGPSTRSIVILDRAREIAEVLEEALTDTPHSIGKICIDDSLAIEIAQTLVKLASSNHNMRVRLRSIGDGCHQAAALGE